MENNWGVIKIKMYCGICGKKMNPGDYWIVDYWGDWKGQEVYGYYCSLKCAMEHRKRECESE